MQTSELLKQLHDKATRGVALSAEEQASLNAWYAQQDKEEDAALAVTPPAEVLAALQGQVAAATAELLTVTQRIQTLATENEGLRREIAVLQKQVLQSSTAQPA